jgi:hypothetical protein
MTDNATRYVKDPSIASTDFLATCTGGHGFSIKTVKEEPKMLSSRQNLLKRT